MNMCEIQRKAPEAYGLANVLEYQKSVISLRISSKTRNR